MRYEMRSLRSTQKRDRRSLKHPAWPVAAAAIFARRLRVEPLESRQLLTAVSWDGGGDGTNWSEPDQLERQRPAGSRRRRHDQRCRSDHGHARERQYNHSKFDVDRKPGYPRAANFQVTTGASSVSGSFNIGSLAS